MGKKLIIRPLKNSPVYVWSSDPEKQQHKLIINKRRLAILTHSPQGDKPPSFDVFLYVIQRPGVEFLFNTKPADSHKNCQMKRLRRGKIKPSIVRGVTKLDVAIYLIQTGNKLKADLNALLEGAKADLNALLEEALKTAALIKVVFDKAGSEFPKLYLGEVDHE